MIMMPHNMGAVGYYATCSTNTSTLLAMTSMVDGKVISHGPSLRTLWDSYRNQVYLEKQSQTMIIL